MIYLNISKEIELNEIRKNNTSFSPSMYNPINIFTNSAKKLRDLLNPIKPFFKGIEPGSKWYLKNSTHYLIRTKALQNHCYLLYPKGDSIVPINPKVFKHNLLSDGDILMSKDSNVGECSIIDKNYCKNFIFSGGIVKLNPIYDKYYLYSFLKHPLFKIQLETKTARGATICHAKDIFLDCLIPFPNQKNSENIIRYISAIMQAIIDKEKEINSRYNSILSSIHYELINNNNNNNFIYSYPNLKEISTSLRFDTGLYCYGFKKFKYQIDNYKFGSTCLSKMGVKSKRGPNLAVSLIGKCLYSEEYKNDWYQLIRPKNISEYGTLTKKEYLGTKKRFPIVNIGNLILGCEGFEKGRSIVILDMLEKCTTNFHGTVLYLPNSDLWQIIFIHCFFSYLRNQGVIDWVGVGGSGGHMSPQYFDYLPFPKFPYEKQKEIARFYHNPCPPPEDTPSLDTFVKWHSCWNEKLGIYELDHEIKSLQSILINIQDLIIKGKEVCEPNFKDK